MAKQINQGGNQMKRKKLMALFMTTAVAASMLTGCGGGASIATDSNASGTGSTEAGSESADGDITDFTMFIAMPGSEINDGNEIQELIAQKTGVRVKETWLTGQTAEEAIGTIIAGGEYPRTAMVKIRPQHTMMKHSGFSARYWSGPDIHRLTLWTNISSY